MNTISKINFSKSFLQSKPENSKYLKSNSEQKDSLEISNTSKAFTRIDKFLNLGRPDRLDVDDLNAEEKKEFLKMLSYLLKKGIVGYEVLEINGKPEKHYIVNQIGNLRLEGAKIYNKNGYYDD
ncbi:MAG: hypothetical protein NTX22_11380 [Ignavibacteriales bacterium]|nr:hypothetical protein [Ignavibacteriales bacterium]